jgi:hypothetical protein
MDDKTINITKEEECETLWSLIGPASDNVTTLEFLLTRTREIVDEHCRGPMHADGDDGPDWFRISWTMLGIFEGFMEHIENYCFAYKSMLQEVMNALDIEELVAIPVED